MTQTLTAWPAAQKPPLGCRLDLTHPLSSGLISARIFNENAGKLSNDLARNAPGTLLGTATWGSTNTASALRVLGSTTGANGLSCAGSTRGPSGTIAFRVYNGLANSSGATGYVCDSTGGTRTLFYRANAANAYGWYLNGTTIFDVSQLNLADALSYTSLALVWTPTTQRVYKNGVLVASFSFSISATTTTTEYIGQRLSGAENYTGLIEYFYVWNRSLSAVEVAQITREPYAAINPPLNIRLYVPVVPSRFRRAGSLRGGSRDLPNRAIGV